VTRQQPPPALARLHRLLIVLTLVGLGIVQAGHCATDTTGHHLAGLTDAIAMVNTTPDGTRSVDDHRHTQADEESPDTSADECHISASSTLGTTTAPGAAAPERVHTASMTPRPRYLIHRPPPGLTLAYIGVSRT
jgi:hypothetical protein